MFKRGIFFADPENDIWVIHDDVKSLYPSSMVVLNLSPESVHLVELKPYTGEYRFDYENNIIEVPDKTLNKQVVVRVDREDSITRKFMIKMRDYRDELRGQGDTMDIRGQQLGIKLIMNSLYGYNGLEFSAYGSFLVAIVTTAVGRLIMETILETVTEEGYTNIGCDTDGNYHHGRDVSQQINEKVWKIFADYPLHEYLRVETNYYKAVMYYRAKNYLLMTKDDKLKIKGSAFHGRHLPPICRTAINVFGRAMFERKPFENIWKKFYDIKKLDIKEFGMSVTINKDPNATFSEGGYESTSMFKQLTDKLGENAVWGQDVYYVKLLDKHGGFTPLGYMKDKELIRRIDRDYYLDRVKMVVGRLNKGRYGYKKVKLTKHFVVSSGNPLDNYF